MPRTNAYNNIDYSKSSIERIRALYDDLTDDPDYFGFDTYPLRQVELISASLNEKTGNGQAIFELTVTPQLCNKGGNLHGGASCTLLDTLTSTALHIMAKPGFLDNGHVSRTITMSYLRPVPAGTRVRVQCDVQAAGRNTANVVGALSTLDGKLCVTCTHDKAVFSKKPAKL